MSLLTLSKDVHSDATGPTGSKSIASLGWGLKVYLFIFIYLFIYLFIFFFYEIDFLVAMAS